jgi:hypothetical protein
MNDEMFLIISHEPLAISFGLLLKQTYRTYRSIRAPTSRDRRQRKLNRNSIAWHKIYSNRFNYLFSNNHHKRLRGRTL